MSQVRLTIVCSGDIRTAPNVSKALSGAGFACTDNNEMKDPAWGLASYTDPLTAEKAGHPNSTYIPQVAGSSPGFTMSLFGTTSAQ